MGNAGSAPEQRGIFHTFDFESAGSSLPFEAKHALAVGLSKSTHFRELLVPLQQDVQHLINTCALAQETLVLSMLQDGNFSSNLALLLSAITNPFPCLGLLAPKLSNDEGDFKLFLARCQEWSNETAIELMQVVLSTAAPQQLPEKACEQWFAQLFPTQGDVDNEQTKTKLLNLFATAVLVGALTPARVWTLVVSNDKQAESYPLMFLVCSSSNTNNDALITPDFAQFVWRGLLSPQDDKFAFGLLQLVAPDTEQFRVLISLYQLLDEDSGVHLITEPFNTNLPTLLRTTTTATEAVDWNSCSMEWTCAMFAKGLRNANGEVVKFVLSQVLHCENVAFPAWFVRSHLLPRLQIDELYSPSMFEQTGAFRVQATTVATGRTATKKKHAEALGHTLFNLPDSLFAFLNAQESVDDLLSYFTCVVDYKSLSAACVLVEALCRVLFTRKQVDIPTSVFQVLTKIISFHGTHAGQAMKRGNMITACLLNLIVVHGTAKQVLTVCKITPDYFLLVDSPIKMATNRQANFLTMFGESTKADAVVNTTSMADFALVYTAKFAAKQVVLPEVMLLTMRDMFDFALRVLQLSSSQGVQNFSPEFATKLRLAVVEEIDLALQAGNASLALLEDAWRESGQSKAKLSTKMDSLTYMAAQIASLAGFKDSALFTKARTMFLQTELAALTRVKALVVCAVLFEQVEENDSMLNLLCETNDRTQLAIKLTEDQLQSTSEALLWCEFEERKWFILRNNNAGFAALQQCAQAQVGRWEMNSDTVNCHALDCFLATLSQEQNGSSEVFDDFIQQTNFYHICTSVDMQRTFVQHTAQWLREPKTLRTLLTTKHLAVGLVKRLAIHLFQVFWRDARNAVGYEREIFMLLDHVDRVWELQDYSAHEASRTVHIATSDEQLFISRSTKTIHPSAFVAFTCLNWLDEQEDEVFLQDFTLLLMKKLFTLAQFQTKTFSIALLVCSKCTLLPEEDIVRDILQLLQRGGLPPETKENLEMTLVRLISRNKPVLLQYLAEVIGSDKAQNNGYLVMSLLSVASIAWRVDANEDGESVDATMLKLALPWMGCAKSSIRILATNICLQVSKRRKVSEELDMLLKPMETNGQMVRLMQRVTEDQLQNSVLYLQLDLVTLLETRDFNLFGDLCPRDLKVDKIAEFVRLGQEEFFAEFDQSANKQDDEGETRVVEEEASAPLRFQRKIVRPVLLTAQQDIARARKRNLIVVATLVDKIPNLAGLARTCEVFSARTLVFEKDPAEIICLPEFKSISRTAENWLPMISVKRTALREYLNKLRQAEGYVIVGLEQTSDSVMLQDFQWPEHGNVCIVLGAEGTGIPPDVLTCLDRTVEIPQIGHIKSLNVHVSGAMCVWAYTQAMMK